MFLLDTEGKDTPYASEVKDVNELDDDVRQIHDV
jgi:hypothetical protein